MRQLRVTFGGRRLLEITQQDVEQYKLAVAERGLSARTVNRHLVILGGIFRRADALWNTNHNPAAAAKVKRAREQYGGRINFLRPDEVLAVARAASDTDDSALFLTAAMTGLRQGELLALRWREVDFVAESIRVERSFDSHSKQEQPTKSGRVRSVPMAVEVAQALARLRDRERFTCDEDLVFPDWTGSHQYHDDLRVRWYAALRRAGVKRIVFHELRHTFGTMCAASGMDVTTIQTLMGHAHISTTQKYMHFAPKRQLAAQISAAFATGNPTYLTEPAAA